MSFWTVLKDAGKWAAKNAGGGIVGIEAEKAADRAGDRSDDDRSDDDD